MSYRLTQLSPQSTENKLRVIVSHSWSTAPENFREMQFWRSWRLALGPEPCTNISQARCCRAPI